MDFIFLPEKVRQSVLAQTQGREPICSIRGSGAFNAQPGESYVLVYPEKVYLLDRGFGGGDFNCRDAEYYALDEISCVKDKFSSSLKIGFAGNTYEAKVSCAEEDNCKYLLDLAGQFEEKVVSSKSDANTVNNGLHPLLLLAAGMMYVAAGDGEVSDSEQQTILRICSDDTEIFNAAVGYYNQHSFREYLENLSLNLQQKLCFYSNMLEVAMIDGTLSSDEQQMLSSFAEFMKLDSTVRGKIWDVLLIKNQLSVLE